MLFLGQLIFFRPMNFLGTNVYDVPNFLFFGYKDVSNFLNFILN